MLNVTIQPYDDIQNYLDILEQNGGGTLNFNPVDTFFLNSDVVFPSNVTINGNNGTVDFQGGAYSFRFEGSDPYTDGTVSAAYGSLTVTGSGTAWDSSMNNRSILIGDYWYVIDTVNSPTDLTLQFPFIGTDLIGDTYVIAQTLENVGIKDLTILNSAVSIIKGQYVETVRLTNVNVGSGDIGFEFKDSSDVVLNGFSADDCAYSATFDNVPFTALENFSVFSGPVDINRMSNSTISVGSFQAMSGNAISFTNCYNIGMGNFSIIQTGGDGIEFVSGNSDIDLVSGYIDSCNSDGIKLDDTTDGININTMTIKNCGGYGVNIADPNCDDNILVQVSTSGNAGGGLNDLGTGTLKSSAVNNFL